MHILSLQAVEVYVLTCVAIKRLKCADHHVWNEGETEKGNREINTLTREQCITFKLAQIK